MTHDERPVLMTGATGEIGGRLLALLTESHELVRVIARRQSQVDRFVEDGIDAVLGDLDDEESLVRAMDGCERMFLLTAPSPKQLDQEYTAIDAAARSGIQHVVRLSAGDADVESPVPWVRNHAIADRYLQGSGMSWTILRASSFMQNLLTEADAIKWGFLPQTSLGGKASWIDAADVASCAHGALVSSEHSGKIYYLSGPQSLSIPDIAGILSSVLDHRVRYLHLPGPVFERVLRLTGESAWMAAGLVKQFSWIVRGNRETMGVTPAVENLTGTAPRSLAEFARSNASAFSR